MAEFFRPLTRSYWQACRDNHDWTEPIVVLLAVLTILLVSIAVQP